MMVKEQIVKTVVKSGNGGAVWVPKDWLGEEVIVVLPQKPELNLKERIIKVLEPHLKDVISVSIYGSYARNEQTKGSDVDVLVITKDKVFQLETKEFDLISIPIEKLKNAIKKYPAMYYQIVHEAKPLINSSVLDELKKIKIGKENFSDYLKDTRAYIKTNVEFLKLDKLDNGYIESHSILYSTMLRLRGIFILKCILKKNAFSNRKFKKWIMGEGVDNNEFEESYKAYRFIRDKKNTKSLKIRIDTAEKLINILRNQTESLEIDIHGKQKEKA